MLAQILARRVVIGFTLGALAVSAAACAGESPETAPPEGPATSATATTSAEPSPSPSTPTKDPDAWKSRYSPAQLEAYEAALRRFESYESRSEPLWAKGEATPAAERLFKEFFPHPIWTTYFERLKTYEQVEVKIVGTPGVFWSKAKSVTGGGSGVQIQQCVDYTTVEGTQRGKPTVRSPWMEMPQLRTIHLSRPDGYDWLIYGVVDISDGKRRPCIP